MMKLLPDNPFIALLGARLLEWKPGYCEWQLRIRPEFMNTREGLHGGATATLLDVACAYSGFYPENGHLNCRASTLSLTTQYLSPVQGDLVTARGWLTGGGQKIYFADAELLEGDKVVAKASGNFRRYFVD
ncbi:PaaI family thioesterase [Marinobacter sp.]|uniref:PaaI family thioesterase n=1 Tax=Marinobacter sp. TaxID=50741 RepID=UPI003567ECDE